MGLQQRHRPPTSAPFAAPVAPSLVFVAHPELRAAVEASGVRVEVTDDLGRAVELLRAAPVRPAVVCSLSCDRAAAMALRTEAQVRLWHSPVVLFAEPMYRAFSRPLDWETVRDGREAAALVRGAHHRGVGELRAARQIAAAVSERFGLSSRQTDLIELLSVGLREQFVAEAMGQGGTAYRKMKSRIYCRCGVRTHGDLMELLLSVSRRHRDGPADDPSSLRQSGVRSRW